jgi:DNA-binding response OmpR family regulator
VSSAPGAGTTFRVYLPAAEEPLPTVTHSNAARAPRGNETILLVEDDDAVRMMTKIILDQNGYQVICAADGLAGVALAERHGAGLDLLITDLVMPSMLGGETAERVKALIPGIRVLYMSGYSEETIGDLGVETTANFLHKPFSLDALSNKVREILDQR